MDDNVHFDAVVLGYSKAGRPRIEFDVLSVGKVRRTVTARAIARQETLPV